MPRPTKWTKEQEDILADMWERGFSLGAIASTLNERFGLSLTPSAVGSKRVGLCLPSRYNPNGWTKEQDEFLADAWENGKGTQDAIALQMTAKFGREFSRGAVASAINRLGLKGRTRIRGRDGGLYPSEEVTNHSPTAVGPVGCLWVESLEPVTYCGKEKEGEQFCAYHKWLALVPREETAETLLEDAL